MSSPWVITQFRGTLQQETSNLDGAITSLEFSELRNACRITKSNPTSLNDCLIFTNSLKFSRITESPPLKWVFYVCKVLYIVHPLWYMYRLYMYKYMYLYMCQFFTSYRHLQNLSLT